MDPYIAKVIKLLDANKALAAFVWPLVAGLVGIGIHWLVTGGFDMVEVRLLIADFLTAAVASGGAYFAPAGRALVDAVPPAVEEPAPNVVRP